MQLSLLGGNVYKVNKIKNKETYYPGVTVEVVHQDGPTSPQLLKVAHTAAVLHLHTSDQTEDMSKVTQLRLIQQLTATVVRASLDSTERSYSDCNTRHNFNEPYDSCVVVYCSAKHFQTFF